MNAVFYYLAYSFLWLITLLPLRVLYLVSWFLTLPLYHLVRYRRKTVMTNLTRSFPGRSRAELRAIARTFYHQLSDYFLEWMFTQAALPEPGNIRALQETGQEHHAPAEPLW
jgi:KDO2-lipid IV(A) lauroyltransferase